MDVLLQDLRYALRSLGRSPGYTAVVATVMALAIAVNVTIFSMAYALLFRPWPLPDSERLVILNMTETKRAGGRLEFSWQTYFDLRERMTTLSGLGAYWDHVAIATLERDPERLFAADVTAGVFDVLGVKPALGRGFTRDEEVRGRNWSQVIISDRLWRDRFGSDPRVLGRTIRMDGREREVVGVMPPRFRWPEGHDLWVPAGFDAAEARRSDHLLSLIGRLAPGASVADAGAEVDAVVRELGRRHSELEDFGGQVLRARESWSLGARPIMTVLLVAVAFVLLIACANIANLMLARAAGRRREVNLRLALGASRGRVVRQLLTESVLVSALGGALGVALGTWGTAVWRATVPVETPFFVQFIVDAPVVLYAAALTLLAGVTFGLAPALHGTDVRLAEAIREGSAQSGTSRKSTRLRNALVVAEIAFSLVLLVGAGLMVRAYFQVDRAGAAIGTEGLLTARMRLPEGTYPTADDRRRFYRDLMARLPVEPAIEAASGASSLPLGTLRLNRRVVTPDMSDPSRHGLQTTQCMVLPGALELLQVPLLRGRGITAADNENAPRVALVSRSLARRLYGDSDPVGRRIRFHDEPDSLGWRTVAGVVGDIVHYVEVDGAANPLNAVYVPDYQEPVARVSLLVRSRGDAPAAGAALRRTVKALDVDLVVEDLRSLREEFRFRLWVRRLIISLLGLFAVLALVISAVGLYGVMAYSVAQRTQEIGIRMALGAEATAVQGMVVRQSLRLTVAGIAIGLAAAFALTRFMQTVLVGLDPSDPPTFTIVTLLLALSGLVAAWVPALRATRVDPIVALRHE
jgi:putative ABC transport system permease protein